ncbi:MAG: OB-fold nucleic acid binding domain-containing protein [Methanothrix sp.]|uniref:OB-fold nucleic acid binding domain-containing protein n=1 Tax=Methanothrix sp. TaxID=90426 RepID=UPI00247D7CDA|nr:OB-fold nucleic acid binding domain-containing protein [Methanothrix sp.]
MVLLLMALSSLAVAYWAFGVSGSDDEISLSGRIVSIRETRTGGHLIITLDSTPMQIFLPARVAGKVRGSLSPGDLVQVRGRVSEYMGRSEIEVSRPSDIARL